MEYKIDAVGLKEVERKLKNLPELLNRNMKTAMSNSLLVLHGNVLPYPPKPEKSTYRRTGTLGRSLGSNEGGGKGGTPTVYSITGSGINMAGKFGTNLNYAKYVIDPDRQAYMHEGRWWTMKNIMEKSKDKINQVWAMMVRAVLNRK